MHGATSLDLRCVVRALGNLDTDQSDAALVDQIRLLEELKSAAAAAQARATVAFVASQRAAQAASGVKAERVGRGIAAQVALAKRCSPALAQRYVGWAAILTRELPATYAALRAGTISEWRAMVIARETAWLSRDDRAAADLQIAPRLEELGDRAVESAVKKIAYRLDPKGYVDRIRGAERDRRVSLRPAPDTMSRLSGFLPVAQGVAAYAALSREADARIAAGDARGRGQIMADTLVERVTGQAHAADVPLEINLVMTDQTLFAAGSGRDEPADVAGYGPVPADVARDLVHRAGPAVPRWIRRLYRRPGAGELVAAESRRRLFTPAQRHFVTMRDQTCRTPWCDAPIRHVDHVRPYAAGGPTSLANAAGLCQNCNHAKQVPGWKARIEPSGDLVIASPTGHHYRSRAPDPPRPSSGHRTLRHRPIIVDFVHTRVA